VLAYNFPARVTQGELRAKVLQIFKQAAHLPC